MGDPHLPEGDKPARVVVAVGPLTSVKEQRAGTYAEAMAERGYAALAFDFFAWDRVASRAPGAR